MTYDYVVVGAGLAGLLSAAMLKSYGYSVAVVEKNNVVGGYLRDIIPGAPFGAHHIGIPCKSILEDFGDKLGIDICGHLQEASSVTVVNKGKNIKLSLRLDEQKRQLSEMYPDEGHALCDYFSYLYGFADALYDDDDKKVKKYFIELSSISYEKLLRKYISNDELVELLSFIGPSYGGVSLKDSAFTFASLVVTYGFGAYYLDTDWFVKKLCDYTIKDGGNYCIITGFETAHMEYSEQKERYELTSSNSKVYGRKVVFAGYFVDILKEYCERSHIKSNQLNKIFSMETGPSAYRFYAKTGKKSNRHEWIVMDEIPAIVSCVGTSNCDYMVTMVTEKKDAEKMLKEHAKTLIKRVIQEPIEDIEINIESSPDHKYNMTGNKNGAVFGWKRNNANNMTSNLVYVIDKQIKDIYVVGNWGPTFGFFGVLYTVKKFLSRQESDIKGAIA